MLQPNTTKQLNKNNAVMLAYLEQVEKAVKRHGRMHTVSYEVYCVMSQVD
ncbi:hypothetical protein [Pasteurella multocida]|nr:hypothetical protein [Pasteurella multocida]MDY0631725.1 hypothetical protein [Pasteurella multocida]HDR1418398.1 hypothetical protein [Pasteurella multocida]